MGKQKKLDSHLAIKEDIFHCNCSSDSNPTDNYMSKVDNWNTRTRCEICSKLTIKIPDRRQWRRSGIFIVNFERILHLDRVFLLLTLSK